LYDLLLPPPPPSPPFFFFSTNLQIKNFSFLYKKKMQKNKDNISNEKQLTESQKEAGAL
jgi:hypothetical protein